jgi:succinate-semialdehyde dehydrogenase/glutarate-semialdehyde dehydrogenase
MSENGILANTRFGAWPQHHSRLTMVKPERGPFSGKSLVRMNRSARSRSDIANPTFRARDYEERPNMHITTQPAAHGQYHIRDSELWRCSNLIAGDWVGADDGSSLDVVNPSSGLPIGKVPSCGAVETRRAIEAAERAWPKWRTLSGKERANILKRWFEFINDAADDLALIMTLEQGKPLAEARGEVAYAASFVEWYAEEAKRIYGDVIPATTNDRRIIVIKQPVGVCAAITPWNFPAGMITRKITPALAAGCPIIVKPASATPLTALALAVLAERAGVPKGILSVITGPARLIGEELTCHPTVRKVTFTGSTNIGKEIYRRSAGTVKKISLELGGNAPFIVFDDADVEAAVAGLMASKFRNMGQTCVCANRVLIQAPIYDDFLQKLSQKVAALKVGDGLEPDSQQGPLIDAAAVSKVEEHIAEAIRKGARVAVGGSRHRLGGNFFSPTVLADVTPNMLIADEETFGPVAPLLRFKAEEEAVQLANATSFGLAAYFYGNDLRRVWRVAEALEFGIVGVNTGTVSTEVAPFGGVKESGVGREGSKYGIDEFVELKYICLAGI